LIWSSCESSPAKPLMAFDASGLGGTQPADHFAVTVETRRTKLDSATRLKLSKFSTRGPHTRKFQHTIPRASLNLFRGLEQEDIASNLPPPQVLPVKTEVVSTRFHELEPSELPAPTGYYEESSSSYEDSEYSSSYSGISHLRRAGSGRHMLSTPVFRTFVAQDQRISDEDFDMDDEEEDDDDSEGGTSIDMLAQAREMDPETVKAREQEFEKVDRRLLEEVPAGSSAATVDGGSGYSSMSAGMSIEE